jgi:hypothetical protein
MLIRYGSSTRSLPRAPRGHAGVGVGAVLRQWTYASRLETSAIGRGLVLPNEGKGFTCKVRKTSAAIGSHVEARRRTPKHSMRALRSLPLFAERHTYPRGPFTDRHAPVRLFQGQNHAELMARRHRCVVTHEEPFASRAS